MPAVTADILSLPRIARPPEAAARIRQVTKVVAGRRSLEGEGFEVRRPFPGVDLSLADPFLLLDHLGAVEYAPGEAKGAPWHPHRGFETVTYILDGAFEHTDSTGRGGLITDGATQWMTAGSGVMHSELPPQDFVATGGLFHGTQLWVNLPRRLKWTPPRYQDIGGHDVTLLSSDDGGALVRIIAGEVAGYQGPGVTWTPIAYLHATVSPGAPLTLPWRTDFNALAYVLSGRGGVGADQRPLDEGELAIFGPGAALTMQAADAQPLASQQGWELLLLGGRPIREPIARYGPFVMNTRGEIIEAVEDFQSGRLIREAPSGLPHQTAADTDLASETAADGSAE